MNITTQPLKRGVLIVVEGRIDHDLAGEFDAALKHNLSGGTKNLAVDLAAVDYINSATVRALVAALKQARLGGGTLVLAAPSPRVREVMEMAGLLDLFPVYPDQSTAVGSF